VAVAAVLVAVGLTLAKDDLGNLFGDDRPSGTSRSPGTGVTTTRIKVADASSFDPDGDGQENTNMADLAIDSDRTRGWQTEGYNQNFGPGGIKPGVGLVLDLGRAQEVAKLSLTLAPTAGSQVTIYGANDPAPTALEGWTALTGEPATVTDRKSFNLEGSHRYLMIWFSSLPQDETGKYRGGVTNVSLTS
jgi:hypothetical protein